MFKGKRKILNEGDLCRRCETPVVFKESKFTPKKLSKPYYFNAYCYCPGCKAMYMIEESKVIVTEAMRRGII